MIRYLNFLFILTPLFCTGIDLICDNKDASYKALTDTSYLTKLGAGAFGSVFDNSINIPNTVIKQLKIPLYDESIGTGLRQVIDRLEIKLSALKCKSDIDSLLAQMKMQNQMNDLYKYLNQQYSSEFNLKEAASELKIHQELSEKPNLIKFYGCEYGKTIVTDSIAGVSFKLSYILVNIVLEKANSDLTTFIKNERPSCSELQHLTRQIINGLVSIHKEGIIHKDMKPANVLIKNDKIMITDFGISEKTDKSYSSSGTLFYMPYEQAGKSKTPGQLYTDNKADVFALSIILLELFAINIFKEDTMCIGFDFLSLLDVLLSDNAQQRPNINQLTHVIEDVFPKTVQDTKIILLKKMKDLAYKLKKRLQYINPRAISFSFDSPFYPITEEKLTVEMMAQMRDTKIESEFIKKEKESSIRVNDLLGQITEDTKPRILLIKSGRSIFVTKEGERYYIDMLNQQQRQPSLKGKDKVYEPKVITKPPVIQNNPLTQDTVLTQETIYLSPKRKEPALIIVRQSSQDHLENSVLDKRQNNLSSPQVSVKIPLKLKDSLVRSNSNSIKQAAAFSLVDSPVNKDNLRIPSNIIDDNESKTIDVKSILDANNNGYEDEDPINDPLSSVKQFFSKTQIRDQFNGTPSTHIGGSNTSENISDYQMYDSKTNSNPSLFNSSENTEDQSVSYYVKDFDNLYNRDIKNILTDTIRDPEKFQELMNSINSIVDEQTKQLETTSLNRTETNDNKLAAKAKNNKVLQQVGFKGNAFIFI